MEIQINQEQQINEPQESLEFDPNYALFCTLDDCKVICHILSALLYKKEGQIASCSITRAGIKFTIVGDISKVSQASAFVPSEHFPTWKFNNQHSGDTVQFRVNFNIFMDCLNIYGSQSSIVNMQLGVGSSSLTIILEDNGVVTECGMTFIDTRDDDFPSSNPFDFRSVECHNKIIMESELLKEAFNEIDWNSPEIMMQTSNEAPYFRLSTENQVTGSCQVDYPFDSDAMEKFECTRDQTHKYKLSALTPSVKALSISSRTQLRVNELGILSLQHMIKGEDKHYYFVDFFVKPMEDEDNS